MNSEHKEILRKILYAVETGGQVYGNQRYDDFTPAGTNTANEKAITIGAGQWYATEAKKLIEKIRNVDVDLFRKLDTDGISNDLNNANWNTYDIAKTSRKAKCIVKIISSDLGISVQDDLMNEQIETYEKEMINLGVLDIQAIMMCINIRHLGGLSAVKRILRKTNKPYTLNAIFTALKTDQQDNSSNNQVGDKLYWSRQEKVYEWIKEKVKSTNGGNVMTFAEKRRVVRDYVFSREGKNKYTQSTKRTQVDSGYSDCSSLQQRAYKEIGIDIGSYTGAQIVNGEWVEIGSELPDETKMEIGDLLFFATNYDNGRPYRVGHVEMYVGNGQISGHGSGTGPTRKDMIVYCKQRNAAGKPFIGVKRYIESDNSEKGNQTLSKAVMFVGECTGNDVNVRTGPSTSYPNIPVYAQLDKGNRVDVLEKMGSWYLIRISGKYEGYIYAQYIKKVEEPKEESSRTSLNRNPQWVGKVTTKLNVRTWAGAENPKIKSWPQLAKGNLVDVCDTVKAKNGDDWYYIRIAGKIYGFVSAKYIKKA